MYNFSGIIYRLWAVCGIILLLAIISALFKKPWKGISLKSLKMEIIVILFSVILGIVYLSRIIFPDISVYTGNFIETHRNSRVAPPLPFTSEYVFYNGEGKKQEYYLDSFSRKEICPEDFELNQEYTIYFDKFTDVIVKVEKTNDDSMS